MSTYDLFADDRLPRRTGIERGDGAPVALPGYFAPMHEHYCEGHDHRWWCRADPCVRHEVTPCPVRQAIQRQT